MVENSITVTGASTESFESDIAKWSVQVKTSGKTQIDSFTKHKQSINKTMEFLKAQWNCGWCKAGCLSWTCEYQ